LSNCVVCTAGKVRELDGGAFVDLDRHAGGFGDPVGVELDEIRAQVARARPRERVPDRHEPSPRVRGE
jgi:hypothetical protein